MLSYVFNGKIHDERLLTVNDPPAVFLEKAPIKLFRNHPELVIYFCERRPELPTPLQFYNYNSTVGLARQRLEYTGKGYDSYQTYARSKNVQRGGQTVQRGPPQPGRRNEDHGSHYHLRGHRVYRRAANKPTHSSSGGRRMIRHVQPRTVVRHGHHVQKRAVPYRKDSEQLTLESQHGVAEKLRLLQAGKSKTATRAICPPASQGHHHHHRHHYHHRRHRHHGHHGHHDEHQSHEARGQPVYELGDSDSLTPRGLAEHNRLAKQHRAEARPVNARAATHGSAETPPPVPKTPRPVQNFNPQPAGSGRSGSRGSRSSRRASVRSARNQDQSWLMLKSSPKEAKVLQYSC